MSFVVFAASDAECFSIAALSAAMEKLLFSASSSRMGGEKHTFINLHATFNKYLDLSIIIRSRDFIPLAFIEEERS